jgi:hypothetical protein
VEASPKKACTMKCSGCLEVSCAHLYELTFGAINSGLVFEELTRVLLILSLGGDVELLEAESRVC